MIPRQRERDGSSREEKGRGREVERRVGVSFQEQKMGGSGGRREVVAVKGKTAGRPGLLFSFLSPDDKHLGDYNRQPLRHTASSLSLQSFPPEISSGVEWIELAFGLSVARRPR
jgi:hypothetical protein